MTVNLAQWRAVIGIFNCRSSTKCCHISNLNQNFVSMFEVLFYCWPFCESTFIFLSSLLYIIIILQCHGDIETNPGPRKLKNSFSVCHWNLNSLSVDNFSKLTQLKAYISVYKYDFLCLLETYLDTLIPDNLINIEGYKLIRADHPNNVKRGGVCIYYKESLPVRVINLPYFKEALLLEMNHNNTKVLVSVIYRSPSKNYDEFDSFLSNFQKLLNDIENCKP